VLHACSWLKENAKIRHLRNIPQLCRAISLQLRHISTIGKKPLNSNISSTCAHNMVNFGPLAAEIGWRVWGTPHSKFQRVSCLGFVTAPTSLNGRQPNFARCLAVSWADTLHIHFRGLLPPNGILPGGKIFAILSTAFNRGRHLYSAGRPSRWASAHILVIIAWIADRGVTTADSFLSLTSQHPTSGGGLPFRGWIRTASNRPSTYPSSVVAIPLATWCSG